MTVQKRITFLLLAPLAILLIPFLANMMTPEVNWNLFDFVVAAILLYGASVTDQERIEVKEKTKHV